MSKFGQFADRLLEATWLAIALTVPLYFNVFDWRVFEPDKAVLLRNLCAVLAFAWMVKTVEVGRLSPRELLTGLGRSPLTLAALLFLGVHALTTATSLLPEQSAGGSYLRLQGLYTASCYVFAFFVVAFNVRTIEQVERLITVMIIASVPSALYGVTQAYRLDPLVWGLDVSDRVTSTAGNPIFLAAVLVMVMPLTLVRLVSGLSRAARPGPWIVPESGGWRAVYLATGLVVLQLGILIQFTRASAPGSTVFWGVLQILGVFLLLALLSTELPRGRTLAALAAFGYGAALALQGSALILSQSRGPTLGILASFGVLLLVAVLIWGSRLVRFSALGVGFAGALVVVLLNIPGGPLEPLRQMPYVAPFARLSESGTGTGRVRLLIWNGSLELAKEHPTVPVVSDPFNWLRSLVGYGPETYHFVYHQVFQPELLAIENRTSAPDRAHNMFFDTLVVTGVLGLLTSLLIFHLFIALALENLGFIPARSRRWYRIFFAATGLVGLIGYLAWLLIRGLPTGTRQVAPAASLGLLGAVVAHFVESQFGIGIVATLTYVWLACGAVVAVRLQALQPVAERVETVETKREPERGRPGRARTPRVAAAHSAPLLPTPQLVWTVAYVVASLIGVFLLATFDGNRAPLAMLSLGFGWLVVGLVAWAASRVDSRPGPFWRTTWIWLYGAGVVAVGLLVGANFQPVAADA
ncbi:MAG: O-antigen ligase family protein, partial [Chloroflexi bacterium]|nr:O-antigen ligase family protein [Chloroflexota bacterium]